MARFRSKRVEIKLRERGLILCEGETEAYYFQGFIKSEKNRRKFSAIDVDIYKPKNHSPVGLIDEAKERIVEANKQKLPFNFIWVVFDKDGHENLAKAFSEAAAYKPKIEIAFTSVCFEYYILLHFVKTTRAYTKCDDIIKEVEKYLPGYQKASKSIFKNIEEQIETGLSNSRWCSEQCKIDLDNGTMPYELSFYSNIHELIIFLNEL